jgi:bifunctional DNase/RNase
MRIGRAVKGLVGLFVAGCLLGGCRREGPEQVEVVVARVAVDPATHAPVVLLEDRARTVALPIWVGAAEARAITMQLEGVVSPRPMTHDLMKNVLNRVEVGLKRVVIVELREDTYHASLVLDWRGDEIEIDSRPSDAIALAIRFEQPIFVDASLLRGANAIRLHADSSVSLGRLTVQVLSLQLAEHFRVPGGRGVLVSDAAANGPLKRGDVILEVDGNGVFDPLDFREKVSGLKRRADLLVQRDGGRMHVFVDPSFFD